MSVFWIIIIIGSILFNIICIWGFFHYIRYGGSPLGELKRRLTGTSRQPIPALPYTDENKNIVQQGEDDPLRVVFIGASITNNWDIEKHLPGIHTIKRIGGYVPDLMLHFQRNVLGLKPKAVVIKFCSINIRAERPLTLTQDSMKMMIQLARSNNIIPIPATMIPVGKPGAHIGDFSVIDTIKDFNDWLRNYAKELGLPLLDYSRALEDDNGFLPREYSSDPIHLNERGYEIISKMARPVIYNVLGIQDTEGN